MNRQQAYRQLKQALAHLGPGEAEAEAREALEVLCSVSMQDLLLAPGEELDEEQVLALQELACRRKAGAPLAYLLGSRAFYGMRFAVSQAVLIPRQETELLAERCIEIIQRKNLKTALDLCTGSGCIAICLAKHTAAAVSASDISRDALAIAQGNAEKLGADVHFFASDLLEKAQGPYDLIVSNPPYISDAEYAAIDAGVREQEPALALRGGADGLTFYRRIAQQVPKYLAEGGQLALEIGYEQGEAVCRLLAEQGFD
ncbi:MAG: peptide chain release factor N(5)-glutamine methyltransferase [Clostridiales bacterium]|nr:peptide chain release factor N(5)-glutamine methyltransferase [Clostridiales bacterium]